MKLSISNIAWNDDENLIVYKAMKQYGFGGLEIAPSKLCSNLNECKDEDLIKFKNVVENMGIQVVSLQSLLYGRNDLSVFGNLKSRKDTLEYLKTVILIAKKIGAKNLVFGSPKNRVISSELGRRQAVKIAIDFFSEIGDFAQQNGVYVCLEPNPKSYGTNFLNTIQETVDFLEHINSDGLKLIVDTSEIIVNNEKIENILFKIIPHLSHFHISEPDLSPLSQFHKNTHLNLARILKQINYQGWASIEMKSSGSDNFNNVVGAMELISNIYSTI